MLVSTMIELTKDKTLMEALSTINDPELFIPITDLGLVYGAELKKGVAEITITLTTIGCPLYDVIHDEIKDALQKVNGVDDVNIELTFDPPWSVEMISEEAKIELGLE